MEAEVVRFLTPDEVAQRWGVSADTVCNLWRQKRLRGMQLAGPRSSVRFRLEDVEAFERANTTPPGPARSR